MFKRARISSGLVRLPGVGDTRRHPRVPCADLYCNLGRVLDLCPTGARLVTDRRPPAAGTQRQVLMETESGVIPVPARVVWTERTGLGRYRFALAFDPGDESSRTRMIELYHQRRSVRRRADGRS
ncbi:MAG: PilZ domain-containing protein [Planctomycetota bacterium]